MNGTVVLPSLNRPHLLKEFFKAYVETKSIVPGLVLIDKTDPSKDEYLKLDFPLGWRLALTDGITMGDKIREIWDEIKNLDWVMILNDDHRPRTSNWDQKILSQINGYNIIATNDGPDQQHPWKAPAKLCGAICYSGAVLRAVGWMFPPGLHHLFHDDIWEKLADRTKCAHVDMAICVEHDHAYKHGKEDDTHRRVNSEESWRHDHAVFETWLKNDFQTDLNKLMAIQPRGGLMLATPFHDNTCVVEYAVGLMDIGIFLSANNVHFEFARVCGSSLIPHARNSLVDMFLRSKCQKLLFVDSDQGFHKQHIISLLNSKKPIIAGVTPHKRFPMNTNFEALPEDQHYFPDVANKSDDQFFRFVKEKADNLGEIEVNRVGTGFVMIDRSVFDVMIPYVQKYLPFDDKDKMDQAHHEFFSMGVRDGRFRGEDWLFTTIAKDLKIPIYINSRVCVTHHGAHMFQIDERKRIA